MAVGTFYLSAKFLAPPTLCKKKVNYKLVVMMVASEQPYRNVSIETEIVFQPVFESLNEI